MLPVSGLSLQQPRFSAGLPKWRRNAKSGATPNSSPGERQKPSKVIRSFVMPFVGFYTGLSAISLIYNAIPLMQAMPTPPKEGYAPADFATFRFLDPTPEGRTKEVEEGPAFTETKTLVMSELQKMLRYRPDVLEMLRVQKLSINLVNASSFTVPGHSGIKAAGASGVKEVFLAMKSPNALVTNATDGFNAIRHEFTHQMDLLGDKTDMEIYHLTNRDGILPGLSEEQRTEFIKQRTAEIAKIHAGQSPLRDYVIRNQDKRVVEAEFLSVLTETFFEKPLELRISNHVLYGQMRDFFRYDPMIRERYTPEDGPEPIWRRPGDKEALETVHVYILPGLSVLMLGGLVLLWDQHRAVMRRVDQGVAVARQARRTQQQRQRKLEAWLEVASLQQMIQKFHRPKSYYEVVDGLPVVPEREPGQEPEKTPELEPMREPEPATPPEKSLSPGKELVPRPRSELVVRPKPGEIVLRTRPGDLVPWREVQRWNPFLPPAPEPEKQAQK